MDVVAKLREAVDSIPNGDFSPGLSAIVRHIDAAIKHFERAQQDSDEDAFTDVIYRTNQAYEGSLKEAYRAIANKNPSRKTLFEIEKFFQENKGLRARVLTQMSRYREDYRNPAAHDYKLDFDENEALLAILSVAAFAKLLVDQIAAAELFAKAKSELFDDKVKERISDTGDADKYFLDLSNKLLDFLNRASKDGQTERENTAVISAFLDNIGAKFEQNVVMQDKNRSWWVEWDIVVSTPSGDKIPFDIKSSRGRASHDITRERVSSIAEWAAEFRLSHAILVEGAARGDSYVAEFYNIPSGPKVVRLGRQFQG